MKHTFIRQKEMKKPGCCFKTAEIYEYSEEEQEAVKNSRQKKTRASPPAVKKLNDKYSREYFEWLLYNNFGANDYHVTLTFENAPPPEQARRDLNNYIRRLRRLYKKNQIELKYLYVTEGKKGNTRLHFHIIVNGGIDRSLIEDAWKLGYANADRLRVDANDGLCALSKYLMKSQKEAEKNERAWNGSNNLIRPLTVIDDNIISRRRMRKIQDAQRNDEVKEIVENIYKGWVLIDYDIGTNDVTGRPFARFKLMRKHRNERTRK